MIKSMTGYGWGEGECSAGSVRVEVHSVNYKDFKFSPRLPDFLRYREARLEKIARKTVKRGHLYVNVDADLSTELIGRLLDKDRLNSYIGSVCDAVPEGVTVTADVAGLLGLPGVMDLDSLPEDLREQMSETVAAVFAQALDGLDTMRVAEGRSIENHLLRLCESVERKIDAINTVLPDAVRAHQDRLREKIDSLVGENVEVAMDGGVLSREIAVLAERSDVAEELERLSNHLHQFRRAMEDGDAGAGKKLEFLTQEMHREANTLGSKLPSSDLIHSALDIKSDIHQVREQVMNVQ